mgnify:FL=1|tara:strand:- start:61 stop:780 length:720 start_codon:yes stop_codon:yes gene_type:complete
MQIKKLLVKITKFLLLFFLAIGLLLISQNYELVEGQLPSTLIEAAYLMCAVGSLFIMFGYLPYWILRGMYRLVTEPKGDDSWRFRGDDESVKLRAHWLKDEIKISTNSRKIKRLEKEFNALDKTYKVREILKREKAEMDAEMAWLNSAEGQLKQEKKEEEEEAAAKEANMVRKFGYEAPKIICPHCNEKGKVRRKEHVRVQERTRETGLGALIGKSTITDKSQTNLYCENCETTWSISN